MFLLIKMSIEYLIEVVEKRPVHVMLNLSSTGIKRIKCVSRFTIAGPINLTSSLKLILFIR